MSQENQTACEGGAVPYSGRDENPARLCVNNASAPLGSDIRYVSSAAPSTRAPVSDVASRLWQLLPRGKQHAITRAVVLQRIHATIAETDALTESFQQVSARALRFAENELERVGYIIGACGNGIYLVQTFDEAMEVKAYYRKHIKALEAKETRVVKHAERFRPQYAWNDMALGKAKNAIL